MHVLWGIAENADWATWALVAATIMLPIASWCCYVSLRLERINTRTRGLPRLQARVDRHDKKLAWLKAKLGGSLPPGRS